MALTAAEKAEIVKKFALKPGDTGSSQVQVALLTGDIQRLTEHLKLFKQDLHTRRGLQHKVNARRKLLSYLKRTDAKAYVKLIQALELRN